MTEKCGGVTLKIREDFTYFRRGDLEHFDSELESIFIEVDKTIFNTVSNVVIAVIYRIPDSSVDDVFNEHINDILNVIQKENKLIHVMGDLNIDLLKSDAHKSTSSLLDVLYSYNVFPVITKPTRVTESTATSIDHILTNNLILMLHITKVYYARQFQTIMQFFMLLEMYPIIQIWSTPL